jgi:hypothetical protein
MNEPTNGSTDVSGVGVGRHQGIGEHTLMPPSESGRIEDQR